jgi:hypothetical protein
MEKCLHGGKKLATLEITHVVDFYYNFGFPWERRTQPGWYIDKDLNNNKDTLEVRILLKKSFR